MAEAQEHKVYIWKKEATGSFVRLDISDGINYSTNLIGLHDLPSRNIIASEGYQGGSVIVDAKQIPRQFVAQIHINAGEDVWPIRNAAHNAARDQLIQWLVEGTEVRVDSEYLGTAGTWAILAVVQQMTYTPDTANYEATFLAASPVMKQSGGDFVTRTLPVGGGGDEDVFFMNVGGNIATRPYVIITPTAGKSAYWNYRRRWTATNVRDVDIKGYPIALNFDFAAAISAGKLRSDGGDLRVKVGNRFVDRWFGNFPDAAGLIWAYVDLPPSSAEESVEIEVLYGAPAATPWQNSGEPPIFDLDFIDPASSSGNTRWRYAGAFMDSLNNITGRTWQWNLHYTNSQGIAAIRRSMGTPWEPGPGNSTVNVAGAEVPEANQVQGYAGIAFHHPLWIVNVSHHGYTQTDTTKEKLVLRARTPDGTLEDVWEQGTDTHTTLTEYGPLNTSFAAEREAIVFALRSLTYHTDIAGALGAADRVTLTISTPPALSGPSAEEEIYMLDFTMSNEMTGDVLHLFGTIDSDGAGGWRSVEIDMENQLVTMNGQPFYYALTVGPPIHADWFRLIPGSNRIHLRDVAVAGLSIEIDWSNQRV